jgi:GNAT superfamily N-acetyltransferase
VSFDVRPATSFAGVSAILGPKNPQATVCWCLSHRLDSKTNKALRGPQRGAYVEELTRRPVPPGVLAYDGEDAVGWAAVAPRAQLPYERSRQIPHVDEQPVWTIWCFRVAPGHRGQGVARALFEATGFTLANQTSAVAGGFPRVVMRRELSRS